MNRRRSGHIEFGSTAARDLLAAEGLTDLQAVLAFEGKPLPCRHPFKSICTAELGGGRQRVFIKKQWRRSRVVPRWPDLIHGTAFHTWPVCEWRGLQQFRRIGLDTAEPLAVFYNAWTSCRSAVVTAAVPVEKSLHELIDDGTVGRMDSAARTMLVDAICVVIERIHDARLAWRSMKTKHFFPRRQDDGSWRIWLIDCEGVHGRVTNHYVGRNRQEFLGTLHIAGADADFIGPIEQRLFADLSPDTPWPDRGAAGERSAEPHSRAAGREVARSD
ncbi:MAG: hypothetical protein HQ567_30380 [Candidatus Nealsonbacteria bacterium]|nr:hypothetical protein [Candidatus Nealsonbacteria bacterium]